MLQHNHIIKHLPLSAEYYNDDIAPIAPIAIERHGEQEWRYAVLSLELHGHVGIYSLLGVKMGLYARELLGVEAGALRVISYAGSTPPISCFNDGLQVATEATLGHGLIEVVHPFSPRVEAEFSTHNSTLRLRLKSEYEQLLQHEIEELKALYGLGKEYWDDVRLLALRFWVEWRRKDIFERV